MAKTKTRTLADLGDDPTKEDLYSLAQELDLDGRSTMDRDQLLAAIRNAETPPPALGDRVRIMRSAKVDWPTMRTQIPVPAGTELVVTRDAPADHPAAKKAPVGLLSKSVRLAEALALHASGAAVVLSK